MDPTNNESERMLHKVAIHRKIRQKLVTVGGKIMFGIGGDPSRKRTPASIYIRPNTGGQISR